MSNSLEPSKPGLQVPWGGLSITLAVIALTSLGSLAVVVSVKNIDTLSTVALALAVLSFAAQLIVTLAQGQQTAQLNSDTKAALADMRATTASLLANQSEQFDTVLRAALQHAVPAAVEDVRKEHRNAEATDDAGGSGSDSDLSGDFEERLVTRLEEALRPVTHAPRRVGQGTPASPIVVEDPALRRLLATPLPANEATEAQRLLDEATDGKARRLIHNVSAQLQENAPANRVVNFTRGADGPSGAVQTLKGLGLIEELSAPPSGEAGRARYMVTPRGLKVVRLILAGAEAGDT